MKTGFYPKLAFDGIRKNKKMYLPYILTCTGMVMMYYIILYLQFTKSLETTDGYSTIREMLGLGSWVIAVFSCIFLFYTNSFLIKRRKKEFGLYNILGMDKKNLSKVLFWETLIIALISVSSGLVAGIILSKLSELVFINILKGAVSYNLSVSIKGVLMCVAVFAVIFLLLFLNSLRQIKFANAISLVKSDRVGEKPPKANWVFGIAGVLILAAAYFIAVYIKEPLQALSLFFIAVIMVIVATYLIMISGSVLFCRLLRKNKSYYYKPNHFVSVSSMAYRMKRNGAGLASICILATMVLVMISSTTTLYFGSEDVIKSIYPRDMNIEIYTIETSFFEDGRNEKVRNGIQDITAKYNCEKSNVVDHRCASVAGLITDGKVEIDVDRVDKLSISDYGQLYQFYFIPISDYNRLMGTDYTLKDSEAMIYFYRDGSTYDRSSISFNRGQSFKIVKTLNNFINDSQAMVNATQTMAIFVNDLETATQGINEETSDNVMGGTIVNYKWVYRFDTANLDEEAQIELSEELYEYASEHNEELDYYAYDVGSRASNRAEFFSLYGGLFCLGIILSIVFLLAAVLIIYYKQISEGYEDQSRFEIMQNVGMTKKEIRKSINSQLLTVFFLPLIFAGLHLGFAFPIIRKLLLLFSLTNVTLFIITTVISFLVFAVFYMIVYKITSNAYCKIVSDAKGS